MSGVNPQGCQIYSFKAPSAEDLDHDFLWRSMKVVPERDGSAFSTQLLRGNSVTIGALAKTSLSWSRRTSGNNAKDIALRAIPGHNGIVVRKFFLHVSRRNKGDSYSGSRTQKRTGSSRQRRQELSPGGPDA
jgi:hypothetical protein